MKPVISILLALAGTARADHPKWMFSVGAIARATSSDAHASDDMAKLEAYGWDTGATPMGGVRGDVAYLDAPLVDAGLSFAWAHGRYAELPNTYLTDPMAHVDRITGSSLERGAMLRLHWVRPDAHVAAEPRVEVGLARTTVTLRDVADSRADLYTRIGVDFRVGGRRDGALFTIDDTSVHSDAMVPTGGITFGVSFYWREWPSP